MAGRTREQSDLTSRWNGMGRPVATIEMPTLAIPCSCSCTWTVVRPGPGMACISRLSYRNSLCICRHEPQQPASFTLVPGRDI